MKTDVTLVMVEEHRLILRMIALLENNTAAALAGRFSDWNFFLDGVDFIRNYADRFHHAKEEDVLFKALVANGMPAQNSPVAAMLLTHDQGRACVGRLENAARALLAGDVSRLPELARNADAYAALLREHIHTEDHILYPLAERVLPETGREAMVQDYDRAEAAAGEGFAERYRQLVERWEETGKARPTAA